MNRNPVSFSSLRTSNLTPEIPKPFGIGLTVRNVHHRRLASREAPHHLGQLIHGHLGRRPTFTTWLHGSRGKQQAEQRLPGILHAPETP